MSIFHNINDLWVDALGQLSNAPVVKSRVGKSRELIGRQFILHDPYSNFLTHPIRKLSPWYAASELLWYLSSSNEIEMIKYYAPRYEQFSDDGVTVWGAYGYRWKLYDQLNKVIKLLKESPNSRRAVMTCYSAMLDLDHKSKDIPCTLTLQFLIRDERLICICTMRSNDVWLGLPYDIWCFTCLQILIAQELGIGVGQYIHQPGSLHLYEKNYEKVEECSKWHNNILPMRFDWNEDERSLPLQIDEAVRLEEGNRLMNVEFIPVRKTLLHECVLWCGIKDHKDWIEYVAQGNMQTYMKNIW